RVSEAPSITGGAVVPPDAAMTRADSSLWVSSSSTMRRPSRMRSGGPPTWMSHRVTWWAMAAEVYSACVRILHSVATRSAASTTTVDVTPTTGANPVVVDPEATVVDGSVATLASPPPHPDASVTTITTGAANRARRWNVL